MKDNINYKKIHFIGIGGISMSGIAHILLNWGYEITGSDRTNSDIIQDLINSGANVFIGHSESNITNQDLIVYTAAIPKDNPELLRAHELNIPTMERAEFLGELTKLFSKTIAISGTHGKTTTTSMISMCFLEANLDPSIQVGSILPQINGNYRVGNSNYFIIEACEYVNSFLSFFPQTEIILNIEEEHLDFFKDINDIMSSFNKFVNILPTDGNLIINIDNDNCCKLLEQLKKENIHILTYSLKNTNADIIANNITFDENGCGSFDFTYMNQTYTNIRLNVPGTHNVSNALACIGTCLLHNLSIDSIKAGLLEFTGAARRFEYKGTTKTNAKIYDDYAHHPTEIKALLQSASLHKHNKIIAIFQPHTYSRLKTLFKDFITCFDNADEIILTDIYAAREIDDGTISSQMLADEINKIHPNKAKCISSFDDITEYIKKVSEPDDIILTIGAGTITNISKKILE